MKKQFVLLRAFTWVILGLFLGFSPQYSTASPVPAKEYTCELPPPATLSITGVTASSLSVAWSTVGGASKYKVTVYNMDNNTSYPTQYVNHPQNTLTIAGLPAGTHIRIGVSATSCAMGSSYGAEIFVEGVTSIIIGDSIVEYCNPGSTPLSQQGVYERCLVFGAPPGNNYYEVYKASITGIHSYYSPWGISFAMVAPCKEGLLFHVTNQSNIAVLQISDTQLAVVDANNYDNFLCLISAPTWNSGAVTCLASQIRFTISFPNYSPTGSNGFSFSMYDNYGLQSCYGQATPPAVCGSVRRENEADFVLQIDNPFEVTPNPFNDQLSIRYRLEEDSPVMITLYNGTGQAVRSAQQPGQLPAGDYEQVLETGDLPQGLYYLSLQSNAGKQTRILIKRE